MKAVKELSSKIESIPMFDQFSIRFHPYIVDVKADGHCGYRVVAALLGMEEESLVVVRMHLLKELNQCQNEYIQLFGGENRFEYLKNYFLLIG